MKVLSFVAGVIVGVFGTSGLILAAEVFRTYRKSIDQDPWQEYHCEDEVLEPAPKPEFSNSWEFRDHLKQDRKFQMEQDHAHDIDRDECL